MRFGTLRSVWVARKPPGFGAPSRCCCLTRSQQLEVPPCEEIAPGPVLRMTAGTAFVEYEDIRDAEDAVRKLDGASQC